MKIYPSSHNIVAVDKIIPKDIPLSYLATDQKETEIVAIKEPNIKSRTNTNVMPYEEFDSVDVFLFDDSGERIDIATLIRSEANKYYFVPQNAVEFSPLRFSFNVLAKKAMRYRNDKTYGLRAACIDENLSLAQKLISVFGNAPRRGLSPLNISVNNQDISIRSLTNSSFKENDFVFIQSRNGIHYGSGNSPIDFNSILADHTNVWLSVDSFGQLLEATNSNQFVLRQSDLYRNREHNIPNGHRHFVLEKEENINGEISIIEQEHAAFPRLDYDYQNLFIGNCPILILEKKKNGFIVVTHNTFFEHINDNFKLFYEVIMNVFMRAYYRTPERNIWIADQIVDYIALQQTRYGFHHEKINIQDMLYNGRYEIDNEFALVEVKTSHQGIAFSGINERGVLLFSKIDAPPDPHKKDGHLSVYTVRNTIVHHEKRSINKIEDDLIIRPVYTVSGDYIAISPYRSTSLKIHTKTEQQLRIPENHDSFVLSCKNNIFKLTRENNYNLQNDGLKMATIKVIKNIVTKNHDMRILGGGLPEDDQKINFNLLDIGHIEGRPYRIGGALIISLPKRLQTHKDIIENVVNKHCASGDYPIILFE